jgi:hypothetical protein
VHRSIRTEGRIRSIASYAQSTAGRADLNARLDKLRAERRANPAHGMSPPVGPQLRPDEGWDDPTTVFSGLSAARAALAAVRRPRLVAVE